MKRIKDRVEIGIDENGNPVHKWASGSTKKEFHDAIVRIYVENDMLGNLALEPQPVEETVVQHEENRTRFKEYVERWMLMYKIPKLKDTTIQGYRTILNTHLYPAFGLWFIDDISTDDIQSFLNERKDLSRKTLKEILTFFSQVFEAAIEDGIVKKNPIKSKKLVIPSDKKTERTALPLDLFMEILANLDKLDKQNRRLVALLMFTGMRRGEVLGLRWEDIDFQEKVIHVHQNVTFAQNQPHIGDTKTYAGKRTIPLIPVLETLLCYNGETGYIIGGESPISHTMYIRAWNRIKIQVDLHGASAHIFRHTFLTMLSNAGVSPKIIQVIAGHADISTTMNIYTHGQLEEILKAGDMLTHLFGDIAVGMKAHGDGSEKRDADDKDDEDGDKT